MHNTTIENRYPIYHIKKEENKMFSLFPMQVVINFQYYLIFTYLEVACCPVPEAETWYVARFSSL
jgi:hypothetical protein